MIVLSWACEKRERPRCSESTPLKFFQSMGFNVPVGTDHKGNNTDNIAWQRCHDTFSRIDDTPLEVLAVDSQTELRPATSRLHHSDTLAKQRTEKKRTRMMADVFRRPSRSLDGADIDADGHDRASTTYLSAIWGAASVVVAPLGEMRRCADAMVFRFLALCGVCWLRGHFSYPLKRF